MSPNAIERNAIFGVISNYSINDYYLLLFKIILEDYLFYLSMSLNFY
jgi:hypothetical protein